MARRGSKYTILGRKVAQLATNQSELAQILGLTQQSISGKLTGKIAVTLKDLELLSGFYDVPLIYFVASADVTPGLARAWEKILEGPPELHQTMEIASTFSEPFARQMLTVVKAMRNTASYYAEHRLRDEPSDLRAQRAAEPLKNYPES